jgi:L-aspartate oxidase
MTDRIIRTDAVIVGGGVAGLAAALSASGHVAVVSKARFGEGGSTPYAQGGVAVALGEGDSAETHAADTMRVGGGLNEAQAVEVLTSEGPARVRELIGLGARFDRDDSGRLVFGREAGHGLHRIVHANGDSTGAEIMRAMSAAVARRDNVEVHHLTLAVDLVVEQGRVVGVQAITSDGERVLFLTPAVVLATGGVGRLFARTTNPVEVTGDGLAMAARAGARLIDLEFIQFHPTALASTLDPMPLLTEALRGAGAVLVDESGHRYMPSVHPDAELAPRDIVARATWAQLEAGGSAYLDATELGSDFQSRFPTVFAAARDAGLDPRSDPLPVSPAAHYHMGGVDVDELGRSSVPGLWVVGEASSTGVHGANRLASNSLLEGLVFGARVGSSISTSLLPRPHEPSITWPGFAEDADVVTAVRSLMWKHVGLIRNESSLSDALRELQRLDAHVGERLGETANIVLAARLIATAARERRESRGAHFRSDYPDMAATAERHPYVAPSLATVA